MSESGDYVPDTRWQGHNFSAARAQFDVNAGRGYAQAKAKGLTAAKLLPESITTQSEYQLIVDTDFTGSMNGWDATIFSKLPYLEHELCTEYLGAGAEASFGAICDTDDAYPLQISPFAKGTDMKGAITGLVHASGGGGPGHYCEAHGLAALYRCRNTHMPNALQKPIYIIITDEKPYNLVTKQEAEGLAKVVIEKSMTSAQIFKETMEKYSLYLILKPYNESDLSGDKLTGTAKEVYDCWEKIVGANRIALLPDPNRVVDVIFGILAQETGKVDYFRKELEQRQLPDPGGKQKVETVYKSLKTVHALAKPEDGKTKGTQSGQSKTKGLGAGKQTKEW